MGESKSPSRRWHEEEQGTERPERLGAAPTRGVQPSRSPDANREPPDHDRIGTQRLVTQSHKDKASDQFPRPVTTRRAARFKSKKDHTKEILSLTQVEEQDVEESSSMEHPVSAYHPVGHNEQDVLDHDECPEKDQSVSESYTDHILMLTSTDPSNSAQILDHENSLVAHEDTPLERTDGSLLPEEGVAAVSLASAPPVETNDASLVPPEEGVAVPEGETGILTVDDCLSSRPNEEFGGEQVYQSVHDEHDDLLDPELPQSGATQELDPELPESAAQEQDAIPTARVSLALDAPEGEIVASGYLLDRDQIQRQSVLNTQAIFQSELDNAIDVAVVRERTPKEKALLWSFLFCSVVVVVIGVVLGVVFGVVVGSGNAAIENDTCQGAQPIKSGTSVVGTTVGTQVNETNTPVCSGLSQNGQHGVWFSVEGDGGYKNATTCSNGTDFDTQLSVFEGASCEELDCVGASDNFCGNMSAVSWRSNSHVKYFILVHGKNEAQGEFVLTLESESRFKLVTEGISKEFGVDISPSDDPSTPQFRAANWLAQNDTLIEFPLNSTVGSQEFRQRYALAVFYYSTSGNLWTNQLNFLSAGSVCTWNVDQEHGAVCDDNGVVRSLSFGRNNLKGSVPSEIEGLDGLLRIDIQWNSNFDPKLERISKVTTLTSLRISGCRFNTVYPKQIGALTALTSLELSHDRLLIDNGRLPPHGSIPKEIGFLSNLEILMLSKLRVKGTLPRQLMELTALTSLTVREMESLGGSIPREIGQLSNLRKLDFSENQLGINNGYAVPSEIGGLSLLEELDLGNAFKPESSTLGYRRTERLQASIGNLTRLRVLYLNENDLIGSIPSSYANLINLEKLHLQRNKLTGVIPSFLGTFTNLVELGLDGNDFSTSAGFCLPNLTIFPTDEELGCWTCCDP